MLNKNKLKISAAATGIFVASALGVFEIDHASTDKIIGQKTECQTKALNLADECAKTIDDENASEFLVIEVLEAGLLLGAAASGLEFVRTLRKA